MTRPRIPPPDDSGRQDLCCSFCTKDRKAVAKLIAGPGVYICDECVKLCDEIIAEELGPKFGSRNEHPDDELLTSLTRIQAAVSQADAAVHNHVAVLRDRGISWTRIGEALGVSKQAAWERFSGIEVQKDSEAVQPGEAVSFTLLQEQLRSVLDTLSEREAGVVSMRFGLTDGQPKTLDEIGKMYGITRERIRQIESKAMSKLRRPPPSSYHAS